MSDLYFTADLHFGHRKIIEYSKRPWPDVEAMNEGLIERWNAVVPKYATVYVLGDFGFGPYRFLVSVFRRLRGWKHLVKGNHDEKNHAVLELPWKSVSDLTTIRWEGHRFVACHYPIESWKQAHKGYIMVHGHQHNSGRRIPHRFDVGVDAAWDYNPVDAVDIVHAASVQKFRPVDHHA